MLVAEAAATLPSDVVALGVPVTCAEGTTAGGLEYLADVGTLEGAASGKVRSLLPGDPDRTWLQRQGFKAKKGQSLVLRDAAGAPSVVLVGMGKRDDIDAERWRLAAAALVRAAGEGGTAALLVGADAGVDAATTGAAIAEGAVLAAYRFDAYRSTPQPAPVERLVAVAGPGVSEEALAEGVRRGSAAAAAVTFARDLINTPPSELTPLLLAERAREELQRRPGVDVEVWDEGRIAAERLGGLLAVSRGSAEPPRFVRAAYAPSSGAGGSSDEGVPHVVLVGKGITFDSGGLSLKPPDGMMTMKTDMSGAAIVLAVVAACADLQAPVRVTALAPLTENMPGGAAQKPGDVFTARNGKTIEVLNTDAEGRLVLADGLSLAAELQPDAIIDVATLTGAAVIALGSGVAAILGSDEPLVEAVRAAGERAGERLWPMPLPEDYAEHIESEIADMKNIGRPREAGVIAAAMLLARFVGDVPWAHLDIAGPSRSSESSGYTTKGATAFGLRSLLDFLQHYPGVPATA